MAPGTEDSGGLPVPHCLGTVQGMELIGVPLSAPNAAYPTIYALPMLTISMNKGREPPARGTKKCAVSWTYQQDPHCFVNRLLGEGTWFETKLQRRQIGASEVCRLENGSPAESR